LIAQSYKAKKSTPLRINKKLYWYWSMSLQLVLQSLWKENILLFQMGSILYSPMYLKFY